MKKKILVKDARKFYILLVGLFESVALTRYSMIGYVLSITEIVLFFTIVLPAMKEISKQIRIKK